MRIEARDDSFATEDKRFRFPCSVFVNCPECGREIERDFEQYYLSYPSFNTAIDVHFQCMYWDEDGEEVYECDHKWTEQIVLRVTIEEAPGED